MSDAVFADPAPMRRAAVRCAALALACAALAGCGGGGGTAAVPPPPAGEPTLAQRTAAAGTTARGNAACTDIGSFYWEIGDRNAALASGSIGGVTASTRMAIASASKWVYSSYWVQRQGGVLTAEDVKFFNFRSGYTKFSSCIGTGTVQECLDSGTNGEFVPATENKFDYGGGHMQKHAALNGLGALDSAALTTEVRRLLGTEIGITYTSPQLAGGAFSNATEYARLLRKIVSGNLRMREALGTFPVCVDPATCAEAIFTPSPRGEQWHYAIGHWVEDDPGVGDGAFSSPGAFGFYPWIDASKTWYGVLARENLGGTYESIACGRLIRKAWLTGVAQ
ncbi:hypothetical protein ACPOLB_26050 [Rubrivivax sp. RP6-9]|uniref:hypothetical protein n=1 Tax=Rubrivivax sp. RP6-9 TaxID=3415750 RepID=UPI003CC62DFE